MFYFNTGTDRHGIKVYETKEKNIDTQILLTKVLKHLKTS